jgi:hypothetical protein
MICSQIPHQKSAACTSHCRITYFIAVLAARTEQIFPTANTQLGAFVKQRKATISFVMSLRLYVRPSVRPHGITQLPLDQFS